VKKVLLNLLLCSILLAACRSASPAVQDGKQTIVVTYAILGAVVYEVVGTDANVVTLIPNGQDPHEWEPSARDIETLNKADLIVQNGVDLEASLQKNIRNATQLGVRTFTASDYITVRKVGQGEGVASGATDQAGGVPDPHLWTDPLTMKQVVIALAKYLKDNLGLDESAAAHTMESQLDSLNEEIAIQVSSLSEDKRMLVSGHESLGYFADRYGFKLVGAIIPSLNTQAGVSAAQLATLKVLIEEYQVKAIFTELGTPPSIAQAIGQETGVKVVELSTHTLPMDGSYISFMHGLAQTIVENLK
jgi:zinc/manganese transport system substrate-binding protein